MKEVVLILTNVYEAHTPGNTPWSGRFRIPFISVVFISTSNVSLLSGLHTGWCNLLV